jgi:hypothetical protein
MVDVVLTVGGQRLGDYAVSRAGAARVGSVSVSGADGGHRAFGEVVAVADLPFVVGLGQDRAGQAVQGVEVGEDADDVGALLDFLVQPFQRVWSTRSSSSG